MIKIIVVRHFLPEREGDATRLLGELMRREILQDGCIKNDILWAIDDSSMWIDITTLTHSDQRKKWENTVDYSEVHCKMHDLLIAGEEMIMLKIFK